MQAGRRLARLMARRPGFCQGAGASIPIWTVGPHSVDQITELRSWQCNDLLL